MTDGPPWELLVRHAADDLTSREAAWLEAWAAEGPDRARLLHRTARVVRISQAIDAADRTNRVWQRLRGRMDAPAEVAPESRVLPVRRARLDTPVSSRRGLRRLAPYAAAAAVVVASGIAFGVWHSRLGPAPAVREVVTRRGERLEVGLPDGSRVLLGAAGRLRYASNGFARARTVTLEGEAFFTVAHDTAHPFVVHTRSTVTQVVGTVFGIRAYPEDSTVRVTVAEGRVLLRPQAGAAGTGTLLGRDDIGELDAAGRTAVRHGVDASRYLAWVGGALRFDRTPLSEVVRELERWYDVQIVVADAKAAAVPVTATFPTQSADDVTRTLAALLDMRASREHGRIWLRPSSSRR
jgi:transmembrane sensor